MDIIGNIMVEEDKYFVENGKEAEFLIMSAADAGELAYEVGRSEGLEDTEAYVYDLTKWRDKILCVVYDRKFEGFVLR